MTGEERALRPSGRMRLLAAALLTAVLALAAAGTTVAWLATQSSANNLFVAGLVQPAVVEDFPDGATVKQHVLVRNDGAGAGELDIYVRAQVVVSWQGPDGRQLWDEPVAGTDYALVKGAPGTGGTWVKGADGFFYWSRALAASASTGDLIASCQQTKAYDDGRKLVVDIVVQGIQAKPAKAAQEAWGATVDADGVLAPVAGGTGGRS